MNFLRQSTLAASLLSVCGLLNAQLSDPAALRSLAQNLHNAYTARNPDEIAALFSRQSPQRTQVRDASQKLFASASGVREETIGDPEITGNRARVRVERTVDAPRQTNPAPPARERLVLEAVKEQSDWRIWRVIPAAQDLAERLAALETDRDVEEVLARNADQVDADLANALIDLGREARNRGDFGHALKVYDLAYRIAERAGSGLARAQALNNAGLVHFDQGDFGRALERYRQSLALSESAQDDAGTARTLNNIGAVYMDAGELSLAWQNFEKALALGEKLHSSRVISNALGNMAIVHGRRGDYLQAFSLLKRSYDLHEPAGDKRTLAIDLENLGDVFFWQGNYPQAQEYFQRELTESESAHLKPMTATALMSLGQIAELGGNLPEAISKYQKSLSITEELGDKPLSASTLAFIASAQAASGDLARSLEYYQRAVDLQRTAAPAEVPLILAQMAAVYNRKGEFSPALRTAGEALESAEVSGLREVLWRAHLEQGKAQRGLGAPAVAEGEFAKAISTIENLRLDVAGGESERENFFEDKLEPYHRMLDLLVAAGRNEQAFDYAERAKARVLLDVFKNGRTELPALMSAADQRQEETLRVKLASLNAQLLRGRERLPRAQLVSLTAELERARGEYETFETALYAQHPEWRAQTGAVEPATLDQALALIPETGTAFVEFVVTDEKVFALVAAGGARSQSSGKIDVFTAPVTRAQLTARVQRFREQLASRDLGFRGTAADLYRLLLAPAKADLLHKRHLIIVPDGALWELPFQALVDSNGRYLLEDAAISYAPSLTALKAMQQVKQERRATSSPTELLAMGNPTWGGQSSQRVKSVYRDEDLGNLPLAETEVRRLGQIYGEGRSHIFVGKEARESRFKTEAGDAKVLHLATHGILNNASPLYSYLLLAGESADDSEDGLLEARELLQMKLRAELVVLSACETARGRVGAGEGIIGLSWALFVSGVPSTVLSQWKVESASTSRLMVAFHQNRKKNMNDAEALRAAALSVRKDPASEHPFYWAPFIVIGAAQN